VSYESRLFKFWEECNLAFLELQRSIRYEIIEDVQETASTLFLLVGRGQFSYSRVTNHQQMYKESFIISRNTLLHVSTLLGHLQGELLCYRYSEVALYS
jgi:hypothetical protein